MSINCIEHPNRVSLGKESINMIQGRKKSKQKNDILTSDYLNIPGLQHCVNSVDILRTFC